MAWELPIPDPSADVPPDLAPAPSAPLSPMDLGMPNALAQVLGPSPQLPQAPMAPPVMPAQVTQDPRQQLLMLATLGAMLGAGPRSGIGAGLQRGVQQGQQQLQQVLNQRAAIQQAQQQKQQALLAEQQRAAAVDEKNKQQMLMGALTTIKKRVETISTKAQYDQEINGYATMLQSSGFRLDANWLRQAVPYVAPKASDFAKKAVDGFLKNPANAALIKEHPEQLSKVMLTFDRDGDGIPEQVPLLQAAQLAGTPFGVDQSGSLITYPKGTTLDDKASADGIFQTLLSQAKSEGKDPNDPTVRLALQQEALQKAKAATTDPEMAELTKELARQRVEAGKSKTTASAITPGTPEYKVASDLAEGRLTFQQLRTLYSYSRDVNKKLAIYDKASEINPNFSPAAFEMGYKFASNPKIQQQVASINNVLSGVGDLLKASDTAQRTGVTALNGWVVRGGIALGGKRYSNFKTAQTAFADELSGALGYGSATDMSREMGFDMTNPNLSPENFRSAIEDIVVPFINRKKASMLGQMGPYGSPDLNPGATNPGGSRFTIVPKGQ